MTMSAPNAPKPIELPQPQFPMLMLMFTDNLVPDSDSQTVTTVLWKVSKPHPFVPHMNVVRMFVDRGGVEVYSISSDGALGIRDLVPMDRVRLIQEAMPLEVFIDELAVSEAGDDDEEEDPEPDLEGTTEPAPSALS